MRLLLSRPEFLGVKMPIQAFNDIPRRPLPQREGIGGFNDLRDIAALQVGIGTRAFKADESGIWLGAHKWADAPFRVAMDGTVTVGSGYSKINVFKQDGIPTSVSVGDLWFDTNDENKPYRAASVGANEITAGEWEIVDDQRAADALLKAGAAQNLTGDIQVGVGNVVIDGANKRILINDGTNDRILIGYQESGF